MKIHLYATEELRKARKEKNYPQKSLSELISIKLGQPFSRGHYSVIETGTRSVKDEVAIQIAQLLKKPVNKLFTKETRSAQNTTEE